MSGFKLTLAEACRITIAALTLPAFVNTLALAKSSNADSQSTNLRESCRRAASGLYLAAWDKRLQSSRMVESATEKLAKTKKAHEEEQKKLTTLRGTLQKKGYDLELAQQIDSKSGFIRTLAGQISELQEVLEKAQAAASTAVKQEASRRQEISMVFDIRRDQKGSRPTRLDYKATCPKYRFLCPLPRDHAIQLRESTTLEPCSRYAAQSLTNP